MKNTSADYYRFDVNRSLFNSVARKLIDSRLPRVEYSFTSKGKEVVEILSRLDEILQK